MFWPLPQNNNAKTIPLTGESVVVNMAQDLNFQQFVFVYNVKQLGYYTLDCDFTPPSNPPQLPVR